MEDVPFAWTDFADPQNDNFQINAENPAYKAGKNGASLGDINNYAMEDLPTTQPQHSLQMLVFHHRNGTKMEMDLDMKPSVKLTDDQMVVTLSDDSRKFIKEDIQRITYKYNRYDVNGDNATDVADIATIISVMSGVGIDPDSASNADVNRDGAVDVADIAAIISAMAGNGSSSRSTTSFRGKNDEASGGIIAYGKETICFDDTNLISISHDSPETGEITFTCQDTIIYRSIYDVDSIVFSAAFENIQYEYRILDKESDGMDAIITSTGDFCLIKDDIELRNDSLIAIWGNVNDNEYNYAIIDSLGFINTIIIKDKVYSIIYGNDSITILRDNDWLCNISYDNLKNEEISSSRRLLTPMRASWLTRNPVYKTLCVIDNILGWVEDSSKQLFLYYLRHYGMGNQDINNFLADSSGFIGKVDWLKLIEWLDNLFDYYYFGDNSVKTLDPVKIKPCNYNLPCQVTISLKDTPYYKAMAAHGVSYSLSLTMNLKDKSIGGKSQPKTEHLLDKDIITFNYPNLDIDTYYSYEPRLDVEYQISYKAYFLRVLQDFVLVGGNLR